MPSDPGAPTSASPGSASLGSGSSGPVRRVALGDGGPLPPDLAAIPCVVAVPPGAGQGACALVVCGPAAMLAVLLASGRGPDAALAVWDGWAARTVAFSARVSCVVGRADPLACAALVTDWGGVPAPGPVWPDPPAPEALIAHALIASSPDRQAQAAALIAAGAIDPPPAPGAAAQAIADLRADLAGATADAARTAAQAQAWPAAQRAARAAHDRRVAVLAAAVLAAPGDRGS